MHESPDQPEQTGGIVALQTRIVYALLLVGAVVSLGFLARAGDTTQPSWWFFLPLFGAWVIFPYAAVAIVVRWRPATPASHATLCLAAALLSGFGILSLYSAFVTHLDPQSGIVLVFLPLWQLIGLTPFLLLSRHLARRDG